MSTITLHRGSKVGRSQSGVALLFAIICLFIISAIAAGMIMVANTETNISSNYKDEHVAFFAAKAGMEEVRDRIRSNTSPASDSLSTHLPTTLAGAGNTGVLYVTNPANGENVKPWDASSTSNYPDDEICKENTTVTCAAAHQGAPLLPSSTSGWYQQAASSTTYELAAPAPPLLWKWTRVTLKSNGQIPPYYTNGNSADNTSFVCWGVDTTNNPTNTTISEVASATPCASPFMPVYVLTSLAVTPSGSRRMVQSEVKQDQLGFPTLPPLTLGGPNPTFAGPSGNNFVVDGHDHAGCGGAANGQTQHSTGVPDTPSVVPVVAGIPANRQSYYTGIGIAPDVANVSSQLPINFTSVGGLQNFVSSVEANATQPIMTGPASALASPGTPTAPQVIAVNGDLTLSGNVTGYGILLVTGTLTVSGDFGWNGLILVIGQGVFQGNGGGSNSVNGSIFIAKTLDAMGNPLTNLGSPSFSWNGGGNNGVSYSTGCINQAKTLQTYSVVGVRELMN